MKENKKIGNLAAIEAFKKFNSEEQEGKDVFEYNVFGSPNQKIGQFASQKKLGEWS